MTLFKQLHAALPLMVLTSVCFVAPRLLAEDKAARGKYLVEEVGRCQECHTPKLENGEFDKSKWMKGAVLNLQGITPIKDWHKTSPDLTPAGRLWSRWGEDGLRKYMQTGLTPKNTKAGPPMPTYTLSAADADAVVEYLKTIK